MAAACAPSRRRGLGALRFRRHSLKERFTAAAR
jgi:hypothetical protein